jgi:O-antigen/teichoic acid export membrane protein
MNSTQTIVKNIIWLFIGSFASTILSVALSISIARFLGSVVFGGYSFVIAFVALLSIFLDLGYETLLIRDVAKEKFKASMYVNNIIGIRIILSILTFIAMFLIINILNFPQDIKILVYLFGLAQIILSISNIFRVTMRAFERMDYEAGVNIITNILRCSIGLILLYFNYGLIQIGLAFVFISIVDLLVSFFICEKNFIKTKMQFDPVFFKNTIKIAFPIGLLAIFGLIYLRIDIVILEYFKGAAVVGYYNAAYTLILGFRPIPIVLMNALLPFMAYGTQKSKEVLREVYEKSFKLLTVIGFPITVGIFLLADKFIIVFYGQNYVNSITSLQILSWDILLTFLYLCIWFVLVAANEQNKSATVAGIGALINIVLNVVLIPTYSLVGSSVATIITEFFILLVYILLTFKIGLKIPLAKIFVKPVIASSVMAIFIYFFRDINLYLLICLSILIYFGVFLLIKGFSKEEISLLKNVMIKKK